MASNGFELWCKSLQNLEGKDRRDIYIYIKKKEKKEKRYEKDCERGEKGKKKGKSTSVEERMEKEEGEGEEVGGTIRWKNVIERS